MRLCRCPFILLANFSFSNIHLLIHIIWCLQVLFGLSSPICCLRRRIYYRRLAQVWSRRTEGPTGDDHLGCKEGHLCLFETSPWHSSEPFWAIIWGVCKIFHQNLCLITSLSSLDNNFSSCAARVRHATFSGLLKTSAGRGRGQSAARRKHDDQRVAIGCGEIWVQLLHLAPRREDVEVGADPNSMQFRMLAEPRMASKRSQFPVTSTNHDFLKTWFRYFRGLTRQSPL